MRGIAHIPQEMIYFPVIRFPQITERKGANADLLRSPKRLRPPQQDEAHFLEEFLEPMWIREEDMPQSSERLLLECQMVVLEYECDATHEQLRQLYAHHLHLRQYFQEKVPPGAMTSPHHCDGFRLDLLVQFLAVLEEHLVLVEKVAQLKQQLHRMA